MRLGLGIGDGVASPSAGGCACTAAPPTPGLVAAYAFDEGSGTTAVDARATGTPARSSARRGRPAATAGATLVRRHQRLRRAAGTLGTFYNTGFTLEAWVQKRTATEERRRRSSAPGPGAGRCSGSTISPADTSSRSEQQPLLLPRLGRNPTVGQWQHLAATFDGTTARYYIDGLQVASRTVSGSVGNSNTWRIGAYGSPPGRLLRRHHRRAFGSTTARSAPPRFRPT